MNDTDRKKWGEEEAVGEYAVCKRIQISNVCIYSVKLKLKIASDYYLLFLQTNIHYCLATLTPTNDHSSFSCRCLFLCRSPYFSRSLLHSFSCFFSCSIQSRITNSRNNFLEFIIFVNLSCPNISCALWHIHSYRVHLFRCISIYTCSISVLYRARYSFGSPFLIARKTSVFNFNGAKDNGNSIDLFLHSMRYSVRVFLWGSLAISSLHTTFLNMQNGVIWWLIHIRDGEICKWEFATEQKAQSDCISNSPHIQHRI